MCFGTRFAKGKRTMKRAIFFGLWGVFVGACSSSPARSPVSSRADDQSHAPVEHASVSGGEVANGSGNHTPAYPPRSRWNGEEGTTILRVHVEESGRAGEVELQQSSGFADLDRAAIKSAKSWLFQPARVGGKPVSGWVTVPVAFKLEK